MSGFEGAVSAFDMPASARQAALLLHTMPESDRGWLLQQLPPSQRAGTEQLLAELVALGIPADPALLNQVLAQAAQPGRVPSSQEERLIHRLGELPSRSIGAVLQSESDGLVARVLRLAPWPWREALLDHLGPTRRRRIQEHLSSEFTAVAWNALDLALLDVLCSRAEQGAGRGPSRPFALTARRPWGNRLQDTWRSWKASR